MLLDGCLTGVESETERVANDGIQSRKLCLFYSFLNK